MTSVALADARKNFKKLIDAAARGEVVQITRNGKAVAELRPTIEAEMAYWAKVKPLKIGKGGLSRLLDADRKVERA